MPDADKESPCWKVIALALSVVAMFVSFKSCYISKQALAVSESASIVSTRPSLVISAHQPKGRESFVTAIETPEGVELEVWFMVENKGNSPAHAINLDTANMHFEIIDQTGQSVGDTWPIDIQFPDAITIGPHHVIDLRACVTIRGAAIQQVEAEAELPVEVIVSYDGIFGKTRTRYTSEYKAVFTKDRVKILTSEM